MLQIDPEERPSITDIEKHPALWNGRDKADLVFV